MSLGWYRGFGASFKQVGPLLSKSNYFSNNLSLSFPLRIDPIKFFTVQISEISNEEKQITNLMRETPESGIYFVKFLSNEHLFLNDISQLINKIIPEIEETKYSKIGKSLGSYLNGIREAHLKLLEMIQNLFLEYPEDLVSKFLQIISEKEILSLHTDFMNKYMGVEPQIINFSVECSSKYLEETDRRMIISLFKQPMNWLINCCELSFNLMNNVDGKYERQLKDFAEKNMNLAASIDSIPKLEQLSKMFSSDSFQVVVPGRRFILQGSILKHCRKEMIKREIFLFSDIFVYAQIKGKKYTNPQSFDLIYLNVKEYPNEEKQNLLIVLTPRKSFVIQFSSIEERKLWLKALETASTNAKDNCETSLQPMRMAPIWIQDQETKVCMICRTVFTLINRRHHCRLCGYVVCKNCLTQKLLIESISSTKQVPVCQSCYDEYKKSISEKQKT